MAVSDYSTTPGSNTSISGINIGENCSPGNINNSIRQLMADIKSWYDAVASGGTYQPLDTTLTALAAVATTANKLVYATGSDTFTTTDLTAYARTLLALASKTAVQTELEITPAPAYSGSSASGSINLGNGFKMTWRDVTITGGTSTYVYGNGTTYSTFGKAWIEGDDGTSDVSANVTSHGLSSATIRNNGSAFSAVLFSIGV